MDSAVGIVRLYVDTNGEMVDLISVGSAPKSEEDESDWYENHPIPHDRASFTFFRWRHLHKDLETDAVSKFSSVTCYHVCFTFLK